MVTYSSIYMNNVSHSSHVYYWKKDYLIKYVALLNDGNGTTQYIGLRWERSDRSGEQDVGPWK